MQRRAGRRLDRSASRRAGAAPSRSPWRRTRRRCRAGRRPRTARLPVDLDHLADVGVTPVTLMCCRTPPVAGAHARDDLDPGNAPQRVLGRDADRREVVGRGDRVVGDEQLVDRVLERRLRAPRRARRRASPAPARSSAPRRSRRCAPGCATALPRASAPARAAEPRRRPAEHAGERRDERRREHRDADEQRDGADAEREQPHAVDRPPTNRPTSISATAATIVAAARVRAEAGEARRRQHRALADGGDRRHPRRPQRRAQRREQRDRGSRPAARR